MLTEPPPANLTLQELTEKFLILSENMDFFFYCIMGIVISLMQIGFGYLEAGSTNSKNATNVMFKNMMDSMLCGLMWWLVGYTLAFGEGSSFLGLYFYQGGKDMFSRKQYAHFFFQLSYASTPSTIVSGAVVDRISFIAYVIYSSLISGVVYPIVVHWAWHTDGWLMTFGFKDFCGSGVIHLTGCTCAIVAAVILGARINRFPKPGTELTEQEKIRFEHHNAPMAGLGAMILYTGWFAFNGGSVLHISKEGDGELVAKIMIVTWLSSSGAVLGTLALFKSGIADGNPRWSFINAINAGVSAMAAICAHADAMDMWSGFVCGLVVSLTYCFIKKAVEKLRIDDPIDVIPVHFGGGFWGTVGATLLRQDSLVGGYGTNAGWLIARNLAGALAIMLWCTAWCVLIFGSLRLLGLLRSSPEDELAGADWVKHKEVAYQGFCDCKVAQKKFDISSPDMVISNTDVVGHLDLHRQVPPYKPVDPGMELQERLHHRPISGIDL